MKSSPLNKWIILSSAILAGGTISTNAATRTWVAPENGNWDVTSNWSEAAVPESEDTALIKPALAGEPPSYLTLDYSSSIAINRLEFDSDAPRYLIGFNSGSTVLTVNSSIEQYGTGRVDFYNLGLGGDVTINAKGAIAVHGAISGAHSLTWNDQGNALSLQLLNSNSAWTGGFIINATNANSTVSVESNASLGTGTVTWKGGQISLSNKDYSLSNNFVIQGDRALNFNHAGKELALTGNITGANTDGVADTIRLMGAPETTFILSGSNTNTNVGSRMIFTGTLIADSDHALDWEYVMFGGYDASEKAELYQTDGHSTSAMLIGQTSLNSDVAIGAKDTGAKVTYNGLIQLADGTGSPGSKTFTLTAAEDGRATFTGVINESGANPTLSITKDGAGTVALTGANTYKGDTLVAMGTLLVNNTSGSGTGLGSVTVNANGILGGDGIIAPSGDKGITFRSGSTASAGDEGIGSLTFDLSNTTGNVVFETGSKFAFELGAGLTNDTIAFTGLIQGVAEIVFNNNVIDFEGIETLQAGTYTLFTFDQDGAYSGTLSMGEWLTSFELGSLVYNANNIQLVLIPEPSSTAILLMAGAGLAVGMRRKHLSRR